MLLKIQLTGEKSPPGLGKEGSTCSEIFRNGKDDSLPEEEMPDYQGKKEERITDRFGQESPSL